MAKQKLSFGKAFSQARSEGKAKFTWNNKEYHTQTAEELGVWQLEDGDVPFQKGDTIQKARMRLKGQNTPTQTEEKKIIKEETGDVIEQPVDINEPVDVSYRPNIENKLSIGGKTKDDKQSFKFGRNYPEPPKTPTIKEDTTPKPVADNNAKRAEQMMKKEGIADIATTLLYNLAYQRNPTEDEMRINRSYSKNKWNNRIDLMNRTAINSISALYGPDVIGKISKSSPAIAKKILDFYTGSGRYGSDDFGKVALTLAAPVIGNNIYNSQTKTDKKGKVPKKSKKLKLRGY